jgi:nicotinic acid mononucleotide adenylyltransferase
MNVDYTPDNTFIFSFVRMNPPTPGHLVLIETMLNIAIQLGCEKVYLITSSSLDGKNPLPCSSTTFPKVDPKPKAYTEILDQLKTNPEIMYKSYVLNNMIESYRQILIDSKEDPIIKSKLAKIKIIILCSTGSPFEFIYKIINNDFLQKNIQKVNFYFIVGRDRADFLDTIVDNFRTKNFVQSINGSILEREGMNSLITSGVGSKRKISEINPSEYSASFIRGLVNNDKREEFEQVYSQYISPEDIQKLYETIKIGNRLKPPSSKKTDENPQSKYFDIKDEYGKNLLPVINNNNSGGKKMKRRTRKSRKTKKSKKSRKSRKSKKSRKM